MTEQVVILGAGRPHRGEVASALRTDRGGTPVLEWLIDALGTGLDEVTFVGGFGVEQVRERYRELRLVVPPDWEVTGSAASLLSAPIDAGEGAIVAYSDILVRPELAAALRNQEASIALAWDSRWRERFAGRRRATLAGREKVIMGRGQVDRLGVDVKVSEASGEFVGLVRLSPEAVEWVERMRSSGRRRELGRMHLTGLLQMMVESGLKATGADVAGDWAEIDEPADIARFVLGTKADTLARLRRTVSSARIADQVTKTVGEWEQDPVRTLAAVERAFGGRKLIVRSSTTHEDAFTASNAGGFTSVLGVSADDSLLEAVGRVAASYRRADIDAEVQQVLVQPLIDDVALSGVALTRTLDQGAPWIVVEYTTDGDTEAVTSGSSEDLRTLVIRRGSQLPYGTDRAAASDELERIEPLLAALKEVEGLLGHDGLDVEFAIDRSGAVFLLQVRPLVLPADPLVDDEEFASILGDAHTTWRAHAEAPPHLPGRARALFGVMPDWNPAEIVGTAPGRLALDLYRELITDEIWAVQRAEVGYRDVRPAPLLVTFGGRPFVDVRASFASFLPQGLDEALSGRLLAAALDRLAARPELHDKVEFSVIPTCLDPDWDRWSLLLAEEGFPPDEVGQLREALSVVTANILARVDEDLATVRDHHRRAEARTEGVEDRLERARVLLEEAKRSGTLPFAHLARAAFVAVSLLRGAEASGVLSGTAVAGFHAGIRTVSHELRADAAAVAAGDLAWEDLVTHWGHLRPGTYEVTSARYDADPERFLRPLVVAEATAASGGDVDAFTSEAWDAERTAFFAALAELGLGSDPVLLERTLRDAIEGREFAKLAFTRSLSDAMELIAAEWESRGVGREIIADVPLSLLLPGRDERPPTVAALLAAAEQGQRARRLTEALQLPPLLTVESDLEAFVLSADSPNFVGTRAVIAPVVVLDERSSPTTDVNGRIVLIPRADPGFDWLFGHGLAGLVTLYGGANSHMAIRAAEFGLPAAIGIGEQRFRLLCSATEVELDPRGHTLRMLR